MKILIGAPAKQKPHIFKEYLEGLDNLKIPNGVEVERFFIVNNCDEIRPLLKPEEYTVKDEFDLSDYKTGEQDHMWSLQSMLKMCDLRSMLTDKVRDEGYDFLFSVDTDIVLHPDTLLHLFNAHVPIVSEIFWTRSDMGFEWCNSWLYDQCGVSQEAYEAWRKPGLYRVGMTGACTLIHRSVFEAGASYRRIPNIISSIAGEDRHFCIRAACLGIPMFMDTHVPATHLYRDSEYETYMELKKCSKK